MERRVLGKTGLSVSIITFSGIALDNISSERASDIVSLAIKNDINYFDIAPSYGNSQYVLGPALLPYRKDIYLACKTLKRSAKDSKAEMLESLDALKTDYFDLYQFHGVKTIMEIDEIFAPDGAMETFKWALSEGIIRHIGFTTHFDNIAMELFKRTNEFETMLFPVNYAYRHKKNESVNALQYCHENNIGVIAIKALAERAWRENEEVTHPRCWYKPIYEDLNLARIALNYTLTLKGVTTCPPPGDEKMLELAYRIIKSQGGVAIKPEEHDVKLLLDHADSLSIDDMLF